MKKDIVQHYIEKYAEQEAATAIPLISHIDKTFSQCLVIPAFDEDVTFIERFIQHPNADSSLLIVVVNQPLGDENHRNVFLYNFCKKACKSESENISLCEIQNTSIILVNRFQGALCIPSKQGVGLARKIGCDIATALYQQNIITSPWIYCSDADAHLPSNYFDRKNENNNSNIGAFVFDFHHKGTDTEVLEATLMYENAIKYFAQALDACGSPYGYCSLGSCIAVSAEYYAKVRGFPARSGGEDFYMLNKIAKLGNIAKRDEICIGIDARISPRVPFGTGPAVEKIINGPKDEFRYYNPRLFPKLKEVIQWAIHTSKTFNNPLYNQPDNVNSEDDSNLSYLSEETLAALQSLKVNDFIQHSKQQCKNAQSFLIQFHCWFDALKTLKFLHHLQEQHYEPIPFLEIDTDAVIRDIHRL